MISSARGSEIDVCALGSQLGMLRDRDMLLLTIGFGIGAAMFNAVIALMGAMLRQRGCAVA